MSSAAIQSVFARQAVVEFKSGKQPKMLQLAALATIALSLGAGIAEGRQARGPAAPELLFRMELQNETRLPLRQDSIRTPNADLQLYGDGRNIVVAVGQGANFPRTFFGLCEKPCGFTLRDRNSYFDLRGRAFIRFTTIVSGFHRVRPIIRLAGGDLLIGDQAEGSVADYHQYQISFSECRWLRLDPARGVTLGGTWVENPDLSRVEEVGYFDIIPGSGAHTEGLPVEKQPAPPAGGWIAVSTFELWGQRASRK
jgi:hypothetical protein